MSTTAIQDKVEEEESIYKNVAFSPKQNHETFERTKAGYSTCNNRAVSTWSAKGGQSWTFQEKPNLRNQYTIANTS